MQERVEAGEGSVEAMLRQVEQVMAVQDITRGGAEGEYIARFRGKLRIPAKDAYAILEDHFKDYNATPILRRAEADLHTLYAIPALESPSESNPWVNVGLFLLTLFSMIFTGIFNAAGYLSTDLSVGIQSILEQTIPLAVLYAGSLLSILLAHELGHYFFARKHKTDVTLPYFIPLPFPGSFGTLGAFIRLKSPPKNRRVLLDIGLAGPIAGLVLAIPILLVGLSLSDLTHLPEAGEAAGTLLEGNSILYMAAKYLVKGELLPQPVSYNGMNPILYWVRFLFTGSPTPYGGLDVLLHPMAWAGWAGLLVTALNLIPAGQLDGGHTLFVLIGEKARRLWPFIVVGLIGLGMVWTGWFIWAGLIFFLGRTYAQPLDDVTRLDPRRRALAIFGLILFFLLFTPIPLFPMGNFPG